MRSLRYSGQFKKDAKLMAKRGNEMRKLRAVIEKLINEDELETRYKDHPLHGIFESARDCHIAPDWVVIYAVVGNELRLIRTGTHSDLFKSWQ
jgi:mRNA interferase YafQ